MISVLTKGKAISDTFDGNKKCVDNAEADKANYNDEPVDVLNVDLLESLYPNEISMSELSTAAEQCRTGFDESILFQVPLETIEKYN
jgi:hypothetical protein